MTRPPSQGNKNDPSDNSNSNSSSSNNDNNDYRDSHWIARNMNVVDDGDIDGDGDGNIEQNDEDNSENASTTPNRSPIRISTDEARQRLLNVQRIVQEAMLLVNEDDFDDELFDCPPYKGPSQ
jgi:U3 small nucleolar ribonucleoprotein component